MSNKRAARFNRERIEALADGLFATVMTILVLSLVVPAITGNSTEATLEADLYGLLPDFFAYMITFIFLGILWISHQNVLSHIEVFDLKVQWINIVLLMSIALAPLSTALLGRYPMQPIAVFTYGINALAISVLFNVLWFYPRIQRLTHEEPNPAAIAKRSKIALVGPTVYALATVFAFVAIEVSLGLYVSVTVFYLIFSGKYSH